MDKPDVDFIEGLSPAISIDQKTASRNRARPWARSPRFTTTCGCSSRASRPALSELRQGRHPSDAPTDRRPVFGPHEGRTVLVLATVVEGRKGEYSTLLSELAAQGFSRARVDGVVIELAERESLTLARYEKHTIDVVLDRLSVKSSNRQRLTESVEAALKLTRDWSRSSSSIKTSSSVLREDGVQ